MLSFRIDAGLVVLFIASLLSGCSKPIQSVPVATPPAGHSLPPAATAETMRTGRMLTSMLTGNGSM